MRHAEIGGIAFQLRNPRQRIGIWRLAEKQREQAVFSGALTIDLVDRRLRLAVSVASSPDSIEIRTKDKPRYLGERFDREHTLSGNACPIGHRGLGYADGARKRCDSAGSLDGLL